MAAFLLVFLAQDVGHRLGEVFVDGGGVELRAAEGADLARHGLGAAGVAGGVVDVGRGIRGGDAHPGGGGDGVLVRAEEEELPRVVLFLVSDLSRDAR